MSALLLSLTCTHPTNVKQPFRECSRKIPFGNNMKTKAAKNKPTSKKTKRGKGMGKRHTGPVIIKTESGLHLDLHEGQPHIEPYANGFDLDIQIKEEPESRDINVAIDCNTTSEVFTNVKNELDSEPLAENELHQSAVKREMEGLIKMERVDAEEEENCGSSRGGDDLGVREKASSPSFHPCPHCSVSFTVWDFLEKHIKWVHQEQYLALLRSRLARGAPGGGPVPCLSCAVCGRTFPSRAHLRSHGREAHPGPPPQQRLHPCPAPGCPRSFQYPKNLANHCRRWHGMSADAVAPDDPLAIPPGAGGLRCGECGREFSTRQRLQVHGRVHTGEKPYECRECGKRFSEQSSWRHHMKIHTGEKAHRCPVCGKAFLRSHHLQYHLTTHSGHKEFACPQCGKRFGYKAGLDSHVQSHSTDKPFPCAVCGKAFGTRRNLRVHTRLHSAERRVHQCGDCGLKTGDVGALKVHLRTHTGERPYHCTVCGGRFVRISHLRNHQRTHTGERPYECSQCDKSFAQSGDLAKHKRTHTGERPYECPDCHRRYATSGDLGKHARSHSGLRPYACQQCDKSFRLSGHLKTHLLTHTGEKPFACPKCLRRFARSHHLSGHVARCR